MPGCKIQGQKPWPEPGDGASCWAAALPGREVRAGAWGNSEMPLTPPTLAGARAAISRSVLWSWGCWGEEAPLREHPRLCTGEAAPLPAPRKASSSAWAVSAGLHAPGEAAGGQPGVRPGAAPAPGLAHRAPADSMSTALLEEKLQLTGIDPPRGRPAAGCNGIVAARSQAASAGDSGCEREPQWRGADAGPLVVPPLPRPLAAALLNMPDGLAEAEPPNATVAARAEGLGAEGLAAPAAVAGVSLPHASRTCPGSWLEAGRWTLRLR